MITPLDIENKKFSKRAINGYNTEEVDDFLDELTIAYEKIYKEVSDSKQIIDNLNEELSKYRNMEATLQNTLVMAQSTAEDVKNVAKQQAEMIINEAQNSAKEELNRLTSEVQLKQRELEDTVSFLVRAFFMEWENEIFLPKSQKLTQQKFNKKTNEQ